ncbi:curlin subunit CsgB [Vibrio furnissii]|uniref:curlin subunit CsgB n=1 Tax=Vibrio furnissii TaxID=29494 RepID=UPI001F4FE277|nr:curlin subunit CsgB [Vibrio furnissii]
MFVRITAYVMMLLMEVIVILMMSNMAWSQDRNNQTHDDIDTSVAYSWGGTAIGRFGTGMGDLSPFNELEDIITADNYAEVSMENAIGGEVTIEQYGRQAGNKAKVIQHDSRRSQATIWQEGSANTALITQTGNQNKAVIGQSGYGHEAWINQNGNFNVAAIIQTGAASSLSINQTGHNNQAYIVDKGGSNYGISQNGNDYLAIIGGSGINVYVTQY